MHIEQICTAYLIYMYLFESDLMILFLIKNKYMNCGFETCLNSTFFPLNENRLAKENKIISKMYLHCTGAKLLLILVFQMHWVAFLSSSFCSLQFLHAHLTVSPNKELFIKVAKLRHSQCRACYFVKEIILA